MTLLVYVFVACAGQVELIQPVDRSRELHEQESDLVEEFFSQFGSSWTTSVSVPDRARQIGGQIELFSEAIGDAEVKQEVKVLFDSEAERLYVEVDSAAPIELRTEMTDRGLIYKAKFGEGTASYIVTGFVTVIEEGHFVTQVKTPYAVVRSLRKVQAPGQQRNPGWRYASIYKTATCVCFGLGAGGTCSDDDCDEGVSCGTNRACRWKSGA